MSRAVLISIRPEWVDKIIAGEKTVEIRKTRPNLGTPFKCYMYETQGKSDIPWIDEDGHMIFRGRGKVVAEFICMGIDEIKPIEDDLYGIYDIDDDYVRKTCLEDGAMWAYGNGQTLYGWHISNLKIYDTPKELSKFSRPFENCIGKTCDEFGCALCENGGHIKRPPQSWCYVEELGNG
jgi:hypothetical protein|nr:MAG TPA: helix-turn-helix domain-containing protein [Caudoviricetes sp.]DAV53655.1 MAG TPA: helix-turn-helix domain-containing protein [Caudoviricetes sp.]